MSLRHDSTIASHAIAQMRQWSSSMCIRHSAAHAMPMSMHAVIIDIMDVRSMPMGRIIIRIMAIDMSAVFMHIDAHVIMSPAQASAHIVAAISAAEQASMHSCIIAMSMPMSFFGMVCITFIIMLTGVLALVGGT